MQTRRTLLTGGAGVALIALAGLGYRAWDRGVWSGGEGAAYLPWSDWQGNAAEGIKRPLHAAILAANPHDTQPWLFEVGENAISLFADRARNLGAFDPCRREMHLGLGAAIENLVLAARAFGFVTTVAPADGARSLSPDAAPQLAARVAFMPAPSARDALFAAIPNRHTNRGPYRADQSIDAESLRRFADLATNDVVRVVFVVDKQARGELGARSADRRRICRTTAQSTRRMRRPRRDARQSRQFSAGDCQVRQCTGLGVDFHVSYRRRRTRSESQPEAGAGGRVENLTGLHWHGRVETGSGVDRWSRPRRLPTVYLAESVRVLLTTRGK